MRRPFPLLALGFACMIALLLSVIASGFPRVPGGDEDTQEVVSVVYGNILNDENLVHYMARLPLTLDILRLDWREPILYVDLYMTDQGLPREEVFHDLLEVGRFGLANMKNVSRVMMRVYDERGKHASLLLAVTADRTQALRRLSYAEEEDAALESAEQLVREVFKVQSTRRWQEWYGAE
ncbi:hypothetical protein PRECH8_01760 [Insulibacter thermoxylanivorax]|uniref:Uncharacterized protein n=1 Tax=Insulibacter thermoxylanivorax TaxID=2749268 RepID=A0A916Q9X0_9BACL|nr:hypothetical protein [Insulibacter thermoxylanivorax]GFR36880.1 hypothetical protein PRECH8_01760 [Insulibacter thermoxylanivorax]